ncbi:MAG: 8-oxo-dGTP diphosphatase [Gemmataceae bacterium]|nr:8-oxo-dGTP diphosphatase [Gemmataceae bacterium]
MPYTPILATLGYLLSPDGRQVLLIRRNRRRDDPHFGKCNGLGGKLEAGEDVIAGLRREVREESGLECDDVRLRGTVSWPGFGPRGEDWFGFIFLVPRWHGTPRDATDEGDLIWHPVDRLLELPLWEGDRFFLPMVFDPAHPQFHGVMPYRDGKPVSWSYSVVSG